MLDKLRFKDENGQDYPEWEKDTLKNITIYETSKLSISDLDRFNGECIYEVYDANNIIKKIDTFDQENEYISIIKDGAGAGRLRLCKPQTSVIGTLGYLKPKNVNIKYLYYLMNTKNYNKYIIGGAIPHLYYKDYSQELLYIPIEEEQQKIADFLSAIDDKIENQKEIVANWEEIKKGLIQKIFSQEIRFKDENGQDYPEWETLLLKDCITKGKSGGTPKSTQSDYYNGNINFLSISDITKQGKYIHNTEKTITEKGLNSSSAWIVNKNSLLYTIYASIGFVCINKIPLATSQAIYSMIVNDNNILEYLYYYLLYFKNHGLDKLIETGSQGNLTAETVKNISIPHPSLDEQQKIADFLSTVDKKIECEKNILNELMELKKGLLQRIFA